MRFKWLSEWWQGMLLTLAICIVSIWLAHTGKLTLYIHPRYVLFTVGICSLAIVCMIWGVARTRHSVKLFGRVRALGLAMGVVCLLLVAGMLLVRPAVLTSTAASQRGFNTSALDIVDESSPIFDVNASYEQFTIKEWASLLAQSTDSALFVGKTANITGFVSPTDDNNPDVFYASRFIITCCAVDARPVGVPVHVPNWRNTYKPGQWVTVSGNFIAVAQRTDAPLIAVQPGSIQKVVEPEDPYAW